jgi:predicted house-cleaning noncanonical NTP pyrophosphatase (MazG superfamily)
MALPPEGKLVRDLIPQIVVDSGGYCEPITIDDHDMWEALYDKLLEEACELVMATTKQYRLMELADVYEVLRTQAQLAGITMNEVVTEAKRKRDEKGGYAGRQWVPKFHTRGPDTVSGQ